MNYYETTDIGVYRKENQDTSVVIQNKKLVFAAVCDGMGGHKGGKPASQLTVLAFKKMFKK
jgi:protein phosphatase